MMKRQGLVVFSRGPPRDFGPAFGSDGPLLVGVVFFPSFPFIGVMLFPSSVLGNASGESGVLLVPLSPFSPLISLSLLSSPSPSLFHSLFLSFSVSLALFLSLSSSLYLSHSLSSPFPSPSPSRSHSFLVLFPLFPFFFEGTACTVYL